MSGSRIAPTVEAGSPRIGRRGLDPRTKLAALLVCNGLILGQAVSVVLLPVITLTTVLLITVRIRFALTFVLAVGGFWGLSLLPALGRHWLIAVLGLTGYWMLRFVTAAGLAVWFITSTRSSEFIAGLSALRIPAVVIVPLTVVFRFIPVAVDELRGIIEAMRLRGYSGASAALHPVRTAERVAVPLLSSVSRTADELSAAALIRGLGAPGRPTEMLALRLRPVDLALLLLLAAFVALAVFSP